MIGFIIPTWVLVCLYKRYYCLEKNDQYMYINQKFKTNRNLDIRHWIAIKLKHMIESSRCDEWY